MNYITRDEQNCNWTRESESPDQSSTYQRMHPCRLRLIDWLNLSEMEQNSENKEVVTVKK